MPSSARSLVRSCILLVPLWLVLPAAHADDTDDVMAVLDAYIATETDLEEQERLMTDDRIFIGPGVRLTDNASNMKGQIAGQKLARSLDPDGMMIVTMEDPIVRLYGDTAVASFYRHWSYIPGADAVRAGNAGNSPPSQIVTVVLHRDGRDWKIVHSHMSPMSAN